MVERIADSGDATSSSREMFSLEDLSDDLLGVILSFTDFRSAVRFAHGLGPFWTRRIRSSSSDNNCQTLAASNAFTSLASSSSSSWCWSWNLWQVFYERHGFSREGLTGPDWLPACRTKRRLLQNLLQLHKLNKKGRSCFHLPNRFFSFLPITPDHHQGRPSDSDQENLSDDEDDDDDDPMRWREDPPPIDFDCDAFVLTSTSTGGEFLLLHPLTGTLSVYHSLLENAVRSDEGMMEEAILDAASLILQRQISSAAAAATTIVEDEEDGYLIKSLPRTSSNSPNDEEDDKSESDHTIAGNEEAHDDDPEHLIAADAIAYRVHVNHHMDDYRTPAQQTLLAVDDCFDVNLAEYFSQVSHQEPDEVQVEIAHLGVNAQPILDPMFPFDLQGTMVTVARSLYNDPEPWQEMLQCVEILAWFRSTAVTTGSLSSSSSSSSSSFEGWARSTKKTYNQNDHPSSWQYKDRHVCRFRGSFHAMLDCAVQRRIYVNEPWRHPLVEGGGIFPMAANNHHDGDVRTDHDADPTQRHPAPLHQVVDPILSEDLFALGGTTITVYPMIPFPHGKKKRKPFFPPPLYSWDCRERVSCLALCPTGQQLIVATAQGRIQFWQVGPSQPSPCLVETYSAQDAVQNLFPSPHRQPPSPVVAGTMQSAMVSIHVPKHVPLGKQGFVTLQHDRLEGSVLLLWVRQAATTAKGATWQVASMINLPLAARRRVPQVHYDGRRLIVFGQDHIGLIVLVYHVRWSQEDVDLVQGSVPVGQDKSISVGGDASGGVYNGLQLYPHIYFANRIRHAALGGLEDYESLHMTCNERYLAVNTKQGNLLSGCSFPYTDGILVMDLQDPQDAP